MRATTAQLYPGRDTFEFDQGHVTKKLSTNHRAHFVEWKSSYLIIIPWARVGYNQSHIQQAQME